MAYALRIVLAALLVGGSSAASSGFLKRQGGQQQLELLHQRALVDRYNTYAQTDMLLDSHCDHQKTFPGWNETTVKPIDFIHIPRTGGTSIEACSYRESHELDRWGANHPAHHGPYPIQEIPENGTDANGLLYKHKKVWQCARQHIPPSQDHESFPKSNLTFCVVRNPYDRMVSEYGFMNIFKNADNRYKCTAQGLSAWSMDIIKYLKKTTPYVEDCHLLPQTAFVYGWNTEQWKVDSRVKRCHKVLRTENLKSEFNELMKGRGYPYRLTPLSHSGGTKSRDECGKLRPEDFSPEAQSMIAEYFKDDFELLGYSPKPTVTSIY